MKCPRCSARLLSCSDPEAAGWCPNCGDIFIPVADPHQLAVERHHEAFPNGNRQRSRGPKAPGSQRSRKPNAHGIIAYGCDESPSCLSCPLPECKFVAMLFECACGATFTTPEAHAGHASTCARNLAMVQARNAGKTAKEVATEFGVSLRTVIRAGVATEPTNPLRWIAWCAASGRLISASVLAAHFGLTDQQAHEYLADDWPALIPWYQKEEAHP